MIDDITHVTIFLRTQACPPDHLSNLLSIRVHLGPELLLATFLQTLAQMPIKTRSRLIDDSP